MIRMIMMILMIIMIRIIDDEYDDDCSSHQKLPLRSQGDTLHILVLTTKYF